MSVHLALNHEFQYGRVVKHSGFGDSLEYWLYVLGQVA